MIRFASYFHLIPDINLGSPKNILDIWAYVAGKEWLLMKNLKIALSGKTGPYGTLYSVHGYRFKIVKNCYITHWQSKKREKFKDSFVVNSTAVPMIRGEPVLSTFFWLTVLSTLKFCRLKRVDKMVKSTKNTSWIKLQIKGDIYRFIHNVRYGWIRCG